MDFGIVIKRNDDDFVVFVIRKVYGSGYNVVPRYIDSTNKYDIEEVRTYCLQHSNMVFNSYEEAFEDKGDE